MTHDWTSNDSLTDQELLEQVILFYRERLKDHAPALSYLQQRGLTHPELLEQFEIGLADRSLGRALPHPQLKAGRRSGTFKQRTTGGRKTARLIKPFGGTWAFIKRSTH